MSPAAKSARFVVGIDLGTTNTAVYHGEVDGSGEPTPFPLVQLVAEGETAARAVLPSVLYLAGEHDVPPASLALPWAQDNRRVVGVLARRLASRVAGRLVNSAKSWLCHGGVDREAAILPWGANEDVARLSPVEASTAILAHVRDAWDAEHPDAPLAEQDVVLTVPASFDEVGRELTVQAAHGAGLTRLRLLEEPQSAIYAWLSAHGDWRERLEGVGRILVIDVGGGTTDFSIVAVRRSAEGIGLERVAVGDHILLGGDNMDLALARRVVAGAKSGGLDAARWQQLTALCREAKERLLGPEPPASVPVSITGRGRGVVADTLRADLSPDDLLEEVLEGFFPPVDAAATVQRQAAAGLLELGLPYAADPAVTRHLAEFLRAGAGDSGSGCDAVLFNGGAVTSAAVRERILDVMGQWSGSRPLELDGADLDLAVARGAVAYGFARRGRGVRIAGGSPRAYYLGLADDASQETHRILCIAARGMEEGAAFEVADHPLVVAANQPVRFAIYASSTRTGDETGSVIDVPATTVSELPNMSTVLRFGRSLQAREIPVVLQINLTEIGTLEVWCVSRHTEHRWRLTFDLRARSGPEDAGAESPSSEGPQDSQELMVAEEAAQASLTCLDACFRGDEVSPVGLVRELETLLGAGKDAWPLGLIRRLLDRLLELEEGRGRSPDHEARWFNLAGFLLRPGWGEERDSWRAERLWRLFDPGPEFAGAAQGRAEWWTMWKRAAGGLSPAQQKVLYQEVRPLLVPAMRKKAKSSRWKGGKQETREIWQTVGSLEYLEARARVELGSVLVPRVVKGKANDSEIWALGRLGARIPLYGPSNLVIPPGEVEPWLKRIVDATWARPGPTALAVAQLARMTGDPARDLDAELRARVGERLAQEPAGQRFARWVLEVVSIDASQQALVLSEVLPAGLRLATPAPATAP